MPGAIRNKRQPISCEPCRSRKIRCSRDGLPCSTCVRRAVDCNYAQQSSANMRPSAALLARQHSPALSGQSPPSAPRDNLARRVRRLERSMRRSGHDLLPSSAGSSEDEVDACPAITGAQSRSRSLHLNGTLHVNDKGYVRFIPGSPQWQSSRLGLADSLANAIPDCNPLGYPDNTSIEEIFRTLPSRSYCTELVNVYFRSYASLFHLLHGPTFHRQYAQFEQSAHDTPLAWLALLFAILGTAVHALPSDSPLLDLSYKSHPLEKIENLSSRYRSLAMRCLEYDRFLWNHSVTTLQALILLIYSINHGNGQTWTLLGLAHHLALSIGCHVDPSGFGLDVIQREERRRCWAALKMLYTHQNTAMGHIGISHIHFPSNCRAPADIDDENLLPGTFDDPVEAAISTKRPTQMTYLLLKFRLYDVCSDICDSVLSSRHVNLESIRRLDNIIQREQQAWDARFFSDNQADNLPPHHLAHIYVLQSYAHHLTLLLHQAVILKQETRKFDGILRWSRRRCLDAAKGILDIHEYVYETPQLAPYRWYNRGVGSFHAFHAAVVLVTLCQHGEREDEDIGSNRPALQSCAARFVSMSDLSPFCAKATPLLQGLVRQVENICLSSDDYDGPATAGPSSSDITNSLGRGDVQTLDESRPFPTPTSFASNHFPGITTGNESGREDDAPDGELEATLMPDWSSLLADVQPQQWLSPAVFPLDHWSTMISSSI